MNAKELGERECGGLQAPQQDLWTGALLLRMMPGLSLRP